MKKLNRKKLLETLETARQGYASLIQIALKHEDEIMLMACKSHHSYLNKTIVEIGGENVDTPYWDENVKLTIIPQRKEPKKETHFEYMKRIKREDPMLYSELNSDPTGVGQSGTDGCLVMFFIMSAIIVTMFFICFFVFNKK